MAGNRLGAGEVKQLAADVVLVLLTGFAMTAIAAAFAKAIGWID